MRRLIAFVISLAFTSASAQDVRTYVPVPAVKLCPDLRTVQLASWPDAPKPSFLCAQVEQESCIHLKHPRCWNAHSQLKTSREWGFGLGQTTIAYRKDGSVRFNKQAELREQYASLRGWTDDKKFDINYQMTAIVEMDRGIFMRITDAATINDRLAFTLSAYNGGESGVRQDRLLCSNTVGCNPKVWFRNVELYSLKSRKANPGYGASAFEINREYIHNVMTVRRPKYEIFFKEN